MVGFADLKEAKLKSPLFLLLLMLWLSGCGGAAQTPPSPQALALQATPTPRSRPTLPPTWTPTFTPTPAPPTLTRTSTPTPTLTLTPGPQDICKAFWAVTDLTSFNGASGMDFFPVDRTIALFIYTNAPENSVRFFAVHALTGENRVIDIPGGQINGLDLPLNLFPHLGQYNWSLVVNNAAFGEICQRSGSFVIVGRESTRGQERTIH